MKHIKPPPQETHKIACYALPARGDRKAMRRDLDAVKRILDLEDALYWAIRELKQTKRAKYVGYFENVLRKNRI